MRKVMIGTPCYDGRLDVWYVNSLINTVRIASEYDIEIIPMWVSFDALVQRARNDTIQLALESDVDDLVWIDSDIEWNPKDFFALLNHKVDVVGGTYPKKGDREEYVVRQIVRRQIDPQTNLMEVDGLGTGFARMSKAAMQYLWDNTVSYIDPKDGKERRLICNVIVENGDLVSEDIYMFKLLQDGGYKIYLDASITCNHTGPKKFTGDFRKWYGKLQVPRANKQL